MVCLLTTGLGADGFGLALATWVLEADYPNGIDHLARRCELLNGPKTNPDETEKIFVSPARAFPQWQS